MTERRFKTKIRSGSQMKRNNILPKPSLGLEMKRGL